MKELNKNARDVFNTWALDYHAEGMEKGHWNSVRKAFEMIPDSDGSYLEIGVGNGYSIHYMAEHQYKQGTCYGLNISENMVKAASAAPRSSQMLFWRQGIFCHGLRHPESDFPVSSQWKCSTIFRILQRQ